jgi:hypothetical protein
LYASDVWGYGKKAGLEKYIYNLLEKTLWDQALQIMWYMGRVVDFH